MRGIVRLLAVFAFVSIGVVGLGVAPASAQTTCQFQISGKTMKLRLNCTTTTTIMIPNGFTLDGGNRTIRAIDPPGGHFQGAVVQNAGAVAGVTHLNIVGDMKLNQACNVAGPPDLRLRGILFTNASGAITNSSVTNIHQGATGCQEGNAIEVRNAPFDGTHPATKTVDIEHNTVSNYQKGGIIVSGDVTVTIAHNTVGASATQAILAANSIQLGFGAQGTIDQNSVKGNSWHGADAAATAILLYNSGVVHVTKNSISGNSDEGIYIFTDHSFITDNTLSDTGHDGYYDVGVGNYGCGNTLTHNRATGFVTPYEEDTSCANALTLQALDAGDAAASTIVQPSLP